MIEYLKNSFVISYNSSKLCAFYTLFTKYNLYPLPQHFTAFQHKKLTGPENCSLSHAAIITMAKTLHLPYVCIFEDDAYPCINALNRMQSINDIPKECKLLLLGWCSVGKSSFLPQQQFNKKYNQITNYIGGSQSYIIFKDAYDIYLKKYQTTKADMIFKDISNAYILSSPIFIQYSGEISMNKHIGYIFNGDNKLPPNGFDYIENILKK